MLYMCYDFIFVSVCNVPIGNGLKVKVTTYVHSRYCTYGKLEKKNLQFDVN